MAAATATVLDALNREARLLRAKLRLYNLRIHELERRYGMSSDVFLAEFERGKLGDAEDYFLWWSYLRARTIIAKRLREIKEEIQRLQGVR